MTSIPPDSQSEPWTRRRWIRQFMLGSAVAIGVNRGWRGTLLADISPDTPPSDILPISLNDFPGLLDGSTPSIQLQLSVFQEIIMINRAPTSGEIFVLDSRCTHQGCPVNRWNSAEGIFCPCHGSVYDIDGRLIHGAAGPGQPPLTSYNFTRDGGNLLRIEVPGLNLRINGIAVESATPVSKRLRLSFPVHPGSNYRIRYSPNLQTTAQLVPFATSANGPATSASVSATNSTPLNVWVDDAGSRGFYSIELILDPYND